MENKNEDQNEGKNSLICTGSHLNQRVFKPEDPWLSMESTILAGNLTVDQESYFESNSKPNELSTVDEEKDGHSTNQISIELEPIEDDNVLNLNIDAISDEDVFFDCPSTPCRPRKKFFDSQINQKSLHLNIPLSKTTPSFEQFLVVDEDSCPAASTSEMTEVSSSVNPDQCTGALLVQIIDDFNDHIKDHAQSTPNPKEHDSGYFPMPVTSENPESNSRDSPEIPAKPRPSVPPNKRSPGHRLPTYRPPQKSGPGRRSPTCKPPAPIDSSNKENYHRGKYSRALADQSKSPVVRPRRVKLMKQFFESQILNESQPSHKSVKSSVSSIHCKETIRESKTTYKSVKSYVSSVHCKETIAENKTSQKSTKSTSIQLKNSSSVYYKATMRKSPKLMHKSSADGTSQKKRSTVKSRTSSCSEMSTTESSVSRVSTNRRKSTSDASTDNSKDISKAQQFNYVTTRRYLANQRTTLHVNSPKDSTIKQRKSLGLVVSPILPVREIRKKFSPSFQGVGTTKLRPKKLQVPCIRFSNEK